MGATTSTELLAAIGRLPRDSFSFDELRTAVPVDYEALKDLVFELLSEKPPRLRQVFDKQAGEMRFMQAKS